MALSEYQKKIAAQNIVEGIALDNDLSDLTSYLNTIFNDAPIEVAETTSKEELQSLITAINEGTANNIKISRFLELANRLGIS
jgi:hypothetical protein